MKFCPTPDSDSVSLTFHELFFSLKKSQTRQFPNQGLHRYADVIRELHNHVARDTVTTYDPQGQTATLYQFQFFIAHYL